MSPNLDQIRKQIVEKKQLINNIYEQQLFPAKEKLIELMNEGAKLMCPYKIGEKIEFENEKQGMINGITYFSIDFFLSSFGIPPATVLHYDEAETFDHSQAITIDYNQKEFSFTWEIHGVMINKDGKPGKLKFIPKNPYRNKFTGNKVFEMTLINSLDPAAFLNINDI